MFDLALRGPGVFLFFLFYFFFLTGKIFICAVTVYWYLDIRSTQEGPVGSTPDIAMHREYLGLHIIHL